MNAYDPKAAARRGAELLDREEPGWADGIDVDRLDMFSLDCCMLGQLYDLYDLGTERLSLSGLEPETFGFDILHPLVGSNPAAWQLLGEAWRYEVKTRTLVAA